MRLLSVPLIRQSKGSTDCARAVVAMVLNYYGYRCTLTGLKRQLAKEGVINFLPAYGLFLIRKGFGIELVTKNPEIINDNYGRLSTSRLTQELQTNRRYYGKEKADQISILVDFMKSGGTLKVRIPAFRLIKREIDAGRPLGAAIARSVLYNDSFPRPIIHFVLIVGYDQGDLLVNDPHWSKAGGKARRYSIEDFMYAIHSGSIGDIDNGSIMLFRYGLNRNVKSGKS